MPPSKKENIEPVMEPVVEAEIVTEERPAVVEEDTVTFKRSHFYAALTVLAFSAGVLLGYVVWGFDSGGNTAQSVNPAAVVQAPTTEARQFRRYEIPTENSPALGPVDAPITLVEFSDYECPYCRRWHDEVYEPLLAAYPGQIRFVYKHLPLTSIHPEAFPAAEAAMCAGAQDAFWEFHEKLFGGDALGQEIYSRYAQELGLNASAFAACIRERTYEQAVATDMNFAIDLGIQSTPTFFINGLAVVGAQPIEVFKQVIDQELAGEIPK